MKTFTLSIIRLRKTAIVEIHILCKYWSFSVQVQGHFKFDWLNFAQIARTNYNFYGNYIFEFDFKEMLIWQFNLSSFLINFKIHWTENNEEIEIKCFSMHKIQLKYFYNKNKTICGIYYYYIFSVWSSETYFEYNRNTWGEMNTTKYLRFVEQKKSSFEMHENIIDIFQLINRDSFIQNWQHQQTMANGWEEKI